MLVYWLGAITASVKPFGLAAGLAKTILAGGGSWLVDLAVCMCGFVGMMLRRMCGGAVHWVWFFYLKAFSLRVIMERAGSGSRDGMTGLSIRLCGRVKTLLSDFSWYSRLVTCDSQGRSA